MMLTNQWLEQVFKNAPQVSSQLASVVNHAVQFDCGVTDDLDIVKGKDFLEAKSPYPETLLQFESPNSKLHSHTLVLWRDQESGGAVLRVAQKSRDDKKWKTTNEFSVIRDGDGFEYETISRFEKNNTVKMTFHAIALKLFFILGCSNVKTVDNEPSAALNKKRAKTGKLPIVSFKTLIVVVDDKKTAGQPMGGTHSSPRVHLRRGHIRNIEGGRRVWVQSCVVGSKHGMVMKDYRITTKSALSTFQ